MLTQSRVLELFDYKDGELYWKVSRGSVKKGRKAGNKTSSCGYSTVRVDKSLYLTHRVIFLMFNGYLPEEVDHINMNTYDNRVENLRGANKSSNLANSKMHSHNTSGYKGVSFNKSANKWVAGIRKNGLRNHLGCFNTPEDAHKAYCDAADKLHGEYANYGK
jgi:hypothetical protein